MFDNEDLRAGIRAISVKKKPWDNCKVGRVSGCYENWASCEVL